jgi:hypothetical protein
MKIRAISRKGGCKYCGNMATHKKNCLYAYISEDDSKARYKKMTIFKKIKIIIKILIH